MTRVRIIALGNETAGDDGAAVVAARRLSSEFEVVIAGRPGPALLDLFDPDVGAVIIDVTRGAGKPGTVVRIPLGDLGQALDAHPQVSSHGFGPSEVLRLGRALGRGLPRGYFVGIEGESFRQGEPLSPPVMESMERFVVCVRETARDVLLRTNGRIEGGELEPVVIYSILNSEPAAPGKVRRNIRGEIERITLRALEKDPSQRPQSAGELRDALAPHTTEGATPLAEPAARSFLRGSRRLAILIPGIVAVFVACMLLANLARHGEKVQWAREKALPEIIRMVENEEHTGAYLLAMQAKEYIPSDPVLTRLWLDMTEIVSIHTDPPGADVYFKEYEDLDGEWIDLGRTPLDSVLIPRGFYRWKIEKEGHETLEAAGGSDLGTLEFVLRRSGPLRRAW